MESVSSNDILVAGSISVVAAAPPRRVDHNLSLLLDAADVRILLSSFFSSLLIFLRLLLILLLLANVGRCLSIPNFKVVEEEDAASTTTPRVTITAKAADVANDFMSPVNKEENNNI